MREVLWGVEDTTGRLNTGYDDEAGKTGWWTSKRITGEESSTVLACDSLCSTVEQLLNQLAARIFATRLDSLDFPPYEIPKYIVKPHSQRARKASTQYHDRRH